MKNNEDLIRIVQRFVSGMDRTVDASNPIVDARLEDGSRVHVVFPPVALDGGDSDHPPVFPRIP